MRKGYTILCIVMHCVLCMKFYTFYYRYCIPYILSCPLYFLHCISCINFHALYFMLYLLFIVIKALYFLYSMVWMLTLINRTTDRPANQPTDQQTLSNIKLLSQLNRNMNTLILVAHRLLHYIICDIFLWNICYAIHSI